MPQFFFPLRFNALKNLNPYCHHLLKPAWILASFDSKNAEKNSNYTCWSCSKSPRHRIRKQNWSCSNSLDHSLWLMLLHPLSHCWSHSFPGTFFFFLLIWITIIEITSFFHVIKSCRWHGRALIRKEGKINVYTVVAASCHCYVLLLHLLDWQLPWWLNICTCW